MPVGKPPILAVSSWSLHRTIGWTWWDRPALAGPPERLGDGGDLAILDLPAALARRGFDRLHLCHFHVARRDQAWFGEFRAALAEAGVRLTVLLIDDGDIGHPADARRDIDWIAGWIDDAAALGAEAARVIAGKQKPSPAALDRSVAGLAELSRRGADQGVHIITENWFDLTAGATEVNAILDRLDGSVGLIADFANWKAPAKYGDLAAIFGRATDAHATCYFPMPQVMDTHDYGRILGIAGQAGYAGPYTLIYNGPSDDEWQAIEMEREFVLGYFAAGARRAATG
ncbi:MAG: TIM barrel protein [Bauldia sp.]